MVLPLEVGCYTAAAKEYSVQQRCYISHILNLWQDSRGGM